MVRRSPGLLVIGLGGPLLLAALAALAGCGDDGAAAPALSDAAAHGEELSRSAGCSACHGLNGEGGIGPAWNGLLGSEVELEDGSTVTADVAYLTESITDPSAKVADGFAVSMPDAGLSDADVADLVAYIVSLGASPGLERRVKRLLAAVLAAGALAGCGGGGDRELVGITRDPEPQVDAVALPDVSNGGEPFEFRAPAGGLLVVYFGYTNCPDVCPTTMASLKVALGDLGDDAERVEVAMVTVDPARDTDVLAGYVQSFVPGAHAIATEDEAALQSVAGPFGVSYSVTTRPNGEIQVAHTSYLFAVDDAGKLVLTWPVSADESATSADDLAADMRQLLADPSSAEA